MACIANFCGAQVNPLKYKCVFLLGVDCNLIKMHCVYYFSCGMAVKDRRGDYLDWIVQDTEDQDIEPIAKSSITR